ncbi:MAG: neutral zinc metallopeptidase, partial [Propionibacteriaceae bacterium]|nr:neutral zinc metallopeptidase [Propionibacteriaceae bacterium]
MAVLAGAVLVVAILLVGSLLGQRKPGPAPAPSGSPASTPGPVGYRNEDYRVPPVNLNPPALPQPETLDEAEALLKRNRLYRQKVATPVRCEVADVNSQSLSRAALESHLDQMMGCLLKVWGPTLEAAGWVPVRPSVTVYSSPVNSRCGQTRMSNASYCGGDQQVYVASDVLRAVPGSVRKNRYMVETILAHEFGHAIQARSGILVSSLVLENRAPSTREKNLLSRRTELQADCLAGMF